MAIPETTILNQILLLLTINIKITLNHYKMKISQLKFSQMLTIMVIMQKMTAHKLLLPLILPGEAVIQK